MKSNKSINRRTHKNRLARSRKTKCSNAKNVLKRSTKSQKGYRGGSNVPLGKDKYIELLNELIEPGTQYSRKKSAELLKGYGIAVGTWLIRKSESNKDKNAYSLSVKINDNGVVKIAHLTINYELATNEIVIGELAKLKINNNSTTESVISSINDKVKVNYKGKEYDLVSPLYDPKQVPIAHTTKPTNTAQQEPESPSAHNQCTNNTNKMLDELINHNFTTEKEVEVALDDFYFGTWLIRKNEDGNFYVLSYRTINDEEYDDEEYDHIKITCANDTLILGATNNPSNTDNDDDDNDDKMLITNIKSSNDISNFINNSINNTINKNLSYNTHKASQYTPRHTHTNT